MTNTTTIKRDRKAEALATMTISNLRRFSPKEIGEGKVWEALHRIGVRDGLETAAIVARCGMPLGGVEKAAAKGRKAIEATMGREMVEAEVEAYELGFNGAAY